MTAAGDVTSGLDLAWRLPDVRPQDDLFRHVNGRWLDQVPIPDDRASCGTLLDLKDSTERRLREIVERAAESEGPDGGDEQKIGNLYASFLDEELIERLGIGPLQADLDSIAGLASASSLARVLGGLQRRGISGAFRIQVSTDARQSDRHVLYLSQGGLGLPDESYYHAARFAAVRARYGEHMETVFRLANVANPHDTAGQVVALESRIASWHVDRAAARDVVRGYTLVGRAGLEELAPCFDWDAWLDGLGARQATLSEVVIRQPGFFRAWSGALAETAVADWRGWLCWRLLRAMSPLLNGAFSTKSFAFYEAALTGVARQPERWKRGLRVVESALGDALGRAYATEHFPPRSRELALKIVASLVEAHRRSIEELDWLGQQTKAQALDKLAAFTPKIGYPDRWRDYSSVLIRRDDLVGNVQRARAAELARQFARLGRAADHDEWPLTPHAVNASYDPGMNQVVVPAAILQPPLFSADADPAVNYGAIGAVIGHEISHGFDDQGSRFDGKGNLADWWTASDRAAFEERAAAMIAQFDALSPAQAPLQHVNGKLTVGENLGDLGGLVMSYRAYLLVVGNAEQPVIDGLTGPQRFFMSWARMWRGKVRDAEVIRRLAVDPHSPRELRCNAIVRNLDEFHEAFGVRPGDGMWLEPNARVRIW